LVTVTETKTKLFMPGAHRHYLPAGLAPLLRRRTRSFTRYRGHHNQAQPSCVCLHATAMGSTGITPWRHDWV